MSTDYQRLSVNINSECAEALRRIRGKREISTTEAIRRAIGVLDMLDRQKDAEEVRALEERFGMESP